MVKKANKVVPVQQVESLIYLIRGQKVMLDSDLAALYGVATKVFNQAVRRNRERFPEDFMFQFSEEEFEQFLRSQFVTSSPDMRSQIVTASNKHLQKPPKSPVFSEMNRSQIVTGSEILRSQFVTSSLKHGGRRHLPFVFTEQGIAMLSSVLRSPRAVQVNIEIMRAFVKIRQWLASNAELSKRLDALEKKHDAQFKAVFDAIREIMKPVDPPRKEMGFHTARQKTENKNRLSRALA